jgi:hypothetical protein
MNVHGDDFTATADEGNLKWLEGVLASEFEVKVEVLGPGPGHKQEMRVLNRVLSWNAWGIGYEADPRHAEIAIRQLGLEEAKAVGTPGTKQDQAKAHAANEEDLDWLDPNGLSKENATAAGEEPVLQGEQATKYRAVCARLNYLSQDRPDIKFAVKEASRHMASPKEGDFLLFKRIGRYLQGQPRLLQKFTWQKEPRVAQTHVDSDWAGCKRTCRSTSGGTISLGNHTLTAWSTTQAVVAMSSGEQSCMH